MIGRYKTFDFFEFYVKSVERMRIKFFVVIAVALCTALVSCRNTEGDKGVSDTDSVNVAKRVMRHISVAGDFYHITNIGSVDVVFSEGDYKIDVECDSSLLPYVSTVFDSGTLTVYMKQEEKGDFKWGADKSNVTLYVSCPMVKYIAVCGTGSFKSVGTIHTTDMQVGNLGPGSLELDSVVCETFEYDLCAESNVFFKNIACNKAKLSSRGSGTIRANVDANKVYAILESSGLMECNLRSDDIEISSFSTGNGAFNVDCKQLNASFQGTGRIVLNGHSERKYIKAGRNAVVENNIE